MARTDPTGTSSRARRMAESAEASNAKVKTASVITERVPVQGAHSSVVPQGRPVAGRPQQVALNEFRAACKKVLVFARLDDDQLDQLHAVMVEHAVDAGTVVLVEGEKGAAPRAHNRWQTCIHLYAKGSQFLTRVCVCVFPLIPFTCRGLVIYSCSRESLLLRGVGYTRRVLLLEHGK